MPEQHMFEIVAVASVPIRRLCRKTETSIPSAVSDQCEKQLWTWKWRDGLLTKVLVEKDSGKQVFTWKWRDGMLTKEFPENSSAQERRGSKKWRHGVLKIP